MSLFLSTIVDKICIYDIRIVTLPSCTERSFQLSKILTNELTARRRDVITGSYANISPARQKRPHNITPTQERPLSISNTIDRLAAPHDYEGNKPPIILRNFASIAELDNWTTYALENLYPIVEAPKDIFSANLLLGDIVSEDFYPDNYGHHWLIITNDPEKDIGDLPSELVVEYLQVCLDLYYQSIQDSKIKYISLFKNVGQAAGASQLHPHSQMLAEDVVSPYIDLQMSNAKKFYEENGVNMFDEILKREFEFGDRIIYQNSEFVAFCPYAPMTSYEVHIMPTGEANCLYSHDLSRFEDMYYDDIYENDPDCLTVFADALKNTVSMLSNTIDNLSYSMFLRSCPVNDGLSHDYWRWHLVIAPRFGVYGSYELATHNSAITTTPEYAAEDIKKSNT